MDVFLVAMQASNIHIKLQCGFITIMLDIGSLEKKITFAKYILQASVCRIMLLSCEIAVSCQVALMFMRMMLLSFCQRIYVGCAAPREPQTSLSTILVYVPGVLNSSTKNGE